MKILVMGPIYDADHVAVRVLRDRGVAVLLAREASEAWSLLQLHSTTVDMAIVHREAINGAGEPGFAFIDKVKHDPVYRELPLIITTRAWSDPECAAHQNSPLGGNAYLRLPFQPESLIKLVEAVLGQPIGSADQPYAEAAPQESSKKSKRSSEVPSPPGSDLSIPSAAFSIEVFERTKTGISEESTKTLSRAAFTSESEESRLIPPAPIESTPPSKKSKKVDDGAKTRVGDIGGIGPVDLEGKTGAFTLETNEGHQAAAPLSEAYPAHQSKGDERMGSIKLEFPEAAPPEQEATFKMPSQEAPNVINLEPLPAASLEMPVYQTEAKTIPTAASLIPAALEKAQEPEPAPELEHEKIQLPTASLSAHSNTDDQKTRIFAVQLSEPEQSDPPLFDLEPAPEAPAEPAFNIKPEPKYEPKQETVVIEEPERSSVEREMPYLFTPKPEQAQQAPSPQQKDHGIEPISFLSHPQPIGDAVVPGGAANSPDIETLKKYLLLREQDVAALSAQVRMSREQVKSLEESLRSERNRSGDLAASLDENRKKLQNFEEEKAIAVDSLKAEITELKFLVKAKADKSRMLESQMKHAGEEIELIKERVRSDIRKIRVREKELENRLEIMKKDSEALLSARENKIIELKRKLDLLEFNMDLLQSQHSREKERTTGLKERFAKASHALKVVGGLLDDGSSNEQDGVESGEDSLGSSSKDKAAS